MIPSAHCPKGTNTRYVTAPLQAGPNGETIKSPEEKVDAKEIEKSRDVGATMTGYANIVVKDNLTFEEYQRAIELLAQIEAGTHHVEGNGVLKTDGYFTSQNITYHNEVTTIHAPESDGFPLVVDIEQGLRLQPVDKNGVRHPAPISQVGFVPLGGGLSPAVAPNAPLPANDPTRLNDAHDKATNKKAIASNTNPENPRDMINKYATVVGGKVVNGDRAVVSNDVVMFLDPSVGGSGPRNTATSLRDTPTLPRESLPNFNFK